MFFASNNPKEASLCKSQDSLVKFIDSIDEGFELLELIFDKQGNVVDFVFLEVNPAYEKQTGLKAANIIGKCKKENAPAREQRWYDYAIQAVKTGKILQYDYYNDNVNRYFDTQFIPISTNRIVVLFKDITERKKAEEALIESEEKVKTYLEGSPTAVFVANTDGIILYVNEATSKLLGYSKEEFLHMSVFDVTFEDERKVNFERFNELRKTGKAWGESRFKRKDGSPVFVIFNATKLPDGNMIANCENITERKKMEAVVKESQKKYRDLIESTSDFIWEIDSQGRYTYCSSANGKIMGNQACRNDWKDSF